MPRAIISDLNGTLLEQVKQLQEELATERARQAGAEAATLAAGAADGVIVARRDGLTQGVLGRTTGNPSL